MKTRDRAGLFIFLSLGFSALPCNAQQSASAYPDRPIRLIVPSPPGGGNDIMARIAGQRITEAWGKQVVVDNRPGGGGGIAFETAARANPQVGSRGADGQHTVVGCLDALNNSFAAARRTLLTKPVRA